MCFILSVTGCPSASQIVFVLKSDLGVSEVRGIVNVKCVRDGYQTVQAALLDYTLTCYPTIQVSISIIWSIK